MKIGTIASHSALNIISGAKEEGFETVLVSTPDRIEFYESFGLGSSIVEVESFDEILDGVDSAISSRLVDKQTSIPFNIMAPDFRGDRRAAQKRQPPRGKTGRYR